MLILSKNNKAIYILYGAKNYASSRTVTADIYDNSNTLFQSPSPSVTLTEIGSTGLYGASFTPTTNGEWKIIITENSTERAHASIKITDHDIETVGADVVSIKNVVEHVTYGNSALNDKLDDIEGSGFSTGSDSLKAIKDYLVNTIQASIGGIQNNTKTTISIPTQMLRPTSSQTDFKVYLNVYDASNNMEDPDDQDPGANIAMVSVTAEDESGNDRSSNILGLDSSTEQSLKWMTRESQGRFSCTYRVASSHDLEALNFTFKYQEGGTQEVTEITMDTAANITENDYWWIFSADTSYYLWYDKGTGSDPTPAAPGGAPATTSGIQVDISGDTTAIDVAVTTAAALNTHAEFSAPVPTTATLTVTHGSPQTVREAEDGNVGGAFAVSVTTDGADGSERIIDRASVVVDHVDLESDVDTILSEVQNGTYGLSAIKTLIDTYLATTTGSIWTKIDGVETKIDTIDTNVDDIETIVSSGVHGNAALKTLIDNLQTDVTAIDTDLTNIQGSGFATGTDSLKALSDRQQDMQGTTFNSSTDSLEAIRDAIDGIDVGTGGYIA